MRELKERELAVQIWSKDFPNGDIKPQVEDIIQKLENEGLVVTEIEGPTYHIPDYFSPMHGMMAGWIVYVAEADPIELKKLAMGMENTDGERTLDVDIYLDYFKKIYRKDLD